MAGLHDLWRRLRPADRADPPDADLIARFARHRDEAAFAELVARHGPLVYAACRRHLPDPADVEDAFQATFLVLVRRAGRLRGHDAVGPWLYRVAVWTARSARRRNARHLGREPARVTADTPGSRPAVDARLDLDDALLSLPEKYRVPVVLCHLQGWTRREAAQHLGCPEGTLSALLSRALARLRKRLGTDPAVWLAVPAAVPAGLTAAAARSANLYLSAAAVPPAVADLTRGVLRMFWVKKVAAAGMVLAAAVGLGFVVRESGGPRAVAQAPPAASPPDEVKRLTQMIERERAARERLEALVAKLADRVDALPRPGPLPTRAADPNPPAKKVTFQLVVAGDADAGQSPLFRLTERVYPGEEYRYFAADLPALRRLLARTAQAVPGPKGVHLYYDPGYPAADEVKDACRQAGFTSLTTGGRVPPAEPEPEPVRVVSPADGLVTEVFAADGAAVGAEDRLLHLELVGIRDGKRLLGVQQVRAPVAGRVQLLVAPGAVVKAGEPLLVVTPERGRAR